MKKQSGFTLIEVMVVVVISAIILACAVWYFGDFGQTRKTKLAMTTLAQRAKLAQQKALSTPGIFRLTFTQHGYQFGYINMKENLRHWHAQPDNDLSNANAFPRPLHVVQVMPASRTPILFMPNQQHTPFTILIKNGKKTVQRFHYA